MTATDHPDPRADLERETSSLQHWSTTVTIARGVSYLAYAWVIVSLVILAFGFVLQLLGANPDAGFTQWVYRHLEDVMEPFRGIFPQASTSSGFTLDVSVLFAMFVYSLLALGVRSLIDWLTYRRDKLARQLEHDTAALRRLRYDQRTEGRLAGAPAPTGPPPPRTAQGPSL